MKWKDVTENLHGCNVRVSTNTPLPEGQNSGPFVGTIYCPMSDSVPVLDTGEEFRWFPWWWDFALVKEKV